jgi:hypothetical protein
MLVLKGFFMPFGEFLSYVAVAARVNAPDLERLIETTTVH